MTSPRTNYLLSRALGIALPAIGLIFLIGALVKAPTYGWLHEEAPFRLFGHTYDLDGYSIVPIALELGVIFLLLFGIWYLSKRTVRFVTSIIPPAYFPAPAPVAPYEPSARIEARGITKVYENGATELPALQDINLVIREKESIAIVGKSGSGKSTIMHILATLDKPTSGELMIDGAHADKFSPADLDHLRNRKFGFVFQQFFLNAKNTCLENVTLPLTIMGISKEERRARGLAMLAAVGLQDKASQRAGDLSGGQKQRLCVARALITNPEVIFADEPTGNLDSENGRRVIELLFHLQREQGITLVIVTHDNDIAKMCDRAVTIHDGRIVSITSR